MPLSAERQRARRKRIKEDRLEATPPPKLKRKRCDNCNKLTPITRENKKFCSDECRREFSRHGSAFGPLKQTLEKLVIRWMKAHAAEVNKRLSILEQRIEKIESDHTDALVERAYNQPKGKT